MIYQTETALVCPRADATAQPLVIDLSISYQTEARVPEVAFVTQAKAPELLAAFNSGYLELHKQVTMLEYELVQARTAADKVRAIVLLDRAPGILEARGLINGKNRSGSEDLRNAVLAQDEEYQKAVETAEQIECVVELLKGKLKGFEMAYSSVKKILGEGAFNMLNRRLGSGTGTAEPGTTPIGSARYNK